MSIEKDRRAAKKYDDTIDDEWVDNTPPTELIQDAFLAGIQHARQGEIERFRDLRDMYLDHMEGTTANEFEFWESLYLAAQLILETMEREEKTGSPYPWGDK